MRVLFINHTRTGGGGATIAAERLATALSRRGHEIQWLVKEAGTNENLPADTEVLAPSKTDRLLSRVTNGRLTISPLRPGAFSWPRHRLSQWADVIHLHNMHPDYANFLALPQLSRAKPILWTLHDMWALTGHCAFSLDCNRWQTGCGQCPYLEVYPAVKHDWTATEWKLKNWALRKGAFHFHTPSEWLASCARKRLSHIHDVTTLAYGLDTDSYTPGNTTELRRALGMSESKLTLLLASASLDDPRKPQGILCEAINRAADEHPNKIQVITFGAGDLSNALNKSITLRQLGVLSSDEQKVQAFRAADALLFASKGDNLPLIIQESLSSGLPVIANRVGGVPEMVQPGKTGWLVDDLISNDYSKILCRLAIDPSEANALRQGARNFSVQHFGLEKHSEQIEGLYQSVYGAFHN